MGCSEQYLFSMDIRLANVVHSRMFTHSDDLPQADI